MLPIHQKQSSLPLPGWLAAAESAEPLAGSGAFLLAAEQPTRLICTRGKGAADYSFCSWLRSRGCSRR